jgi:1-acyl-sn-glycerol-3-phosphate acyltransferase
MSDLSYCCAYWLFNVPFWHSSRPVVMHADRAARSGGFILAPNHLSPFEVPLAVRHCPRNIDFMSIIELRKRLIARWFFSLWNTFYLDRSRPDAGAMREAVDRLKRGRVVGMFPEGHIRKWEDSVLNGGSLKPGIAKLAELSDAPVIPCVILDARKYLRAANWARFKRTRYGIIFGEPIRVRRELEKDEARQTFLTELSAAYPRLRQELAEEMDRASSKDASRSSIARDCADSNALQCEAGPDRKLSG